MKIFLLFCLLSLNEALAQDSLSCHHYRTEDKFNGEISIYSGREANISFVKVINNKKITYYLSIEYIYSDVNVGKTGAFILFDDGTKFSRPNEKIDCDVDKSGTGFKYSAFILINPKEMQVFASKKMTDFKLWIYTDSIKEEKQELLCQMARCILLAK